MDTKKLVVGQKVLMVSGRYYGQEVTVVKIEPSGCVVVQTSGTRMPDDTGEYGAMIRFDNNGKACDSRDIYKGNMEWHGIPGTHECGPWELVDERP